MLPRAALFLVSGSSPEAWARRWGIEPFSAPCESCGAERRAVVPLTAKGVRGLAARDCECGESGRVYCMVWTS